MLGSSSYYEIRLTENDQIWIDASELCIYGYNILMKNRIGKRGGGIALIFRLTLNVKWIDQQYNRETFEYCEWLIKNKAISSNIHGIYRPPNSDLNQFFDDLADYLALHVNTNYPIFVADFNIHWGDDVDGNASLFEDTLEHLGLIQHVQFPTHNSNNILDLVISKAIMNKFICDVLPHPCISDHLAIQFSN